ncbi:hypothetical protein TraAM80_03460 [Trypanosoma rangeli]|uniref:Uncharacterized protein n=1 Tax=Trypanosoma rangeli TaxID=5698 RepID=A0A3S5IRK7_TRYRA|nr:uncharacterized protein TraAM80_03460 [Trypanosoma rangeli]RNF07324.1 hypothetical protein TraAM80_03460 [Trypanosoma rangeli]|eukprot:RNF07324.1 hypothetical protein TraAM80_03460 [Trypanosoma rangeli]
MVMGGVGSAVGCLMRSGFEMWSQMKTPEDCIPVAMALFIPTSGVGRGAGAHPRRAKCLPPTVVRFGCTVQRDACRRDRFGDAHHLRQGRRQALQRLFPVNGVCDDSVEPICLRRVVEP